jgi:hypothetical protein
MAPRTRSAAPAAGQLIEATPLGDKATADLFGQAADASVATISPGAPGSASTLTNPVTTSVGTVLAGATPMARALGANLVAAGTTFPDNGYRKPNSQTGGFGAQPFSIAFWLYNATAFEFSVKETQVARYRVRVNGKLVSDNWGAVATNAGGDVPIRVDLPSPAATLQRIDIEYGGSTYAGKFAFPAGAVVYPTAPPAFRGISFGNSFEEPTNAQGADGLGSVMLRDAGIEGAWQSGYGGSGYAQSGSVGTQKTFVQRGTDIDNWGPWDLIAVLDIDNATDPAVIGAAATQFWADRRLANPNAVLVAFGGIYKGSTSDTAQDLAVKAAVEKVGGVFVSMAGAVADANFAPDNVHITAASNPAVGHIMFTRMAAALLAKGIQTPARQSIAGRVAAITDALNAHNATKGVHGFADITALANLHQPDIQVFTGNGTWSKPSWAKSVRVICQAGGGGGGSGRVSASGTAAAGGGGGGGGGRVTADFLAANLPASVGLTVGAGGNGGAAQATDSTNGNAGGNGGASNFGTYAATQSGLGGGGGSTSTGTAGASQSTGGSAGGAGGTGAGAAAGATAGGATGGGAGGGISTAPAAAAGGSGGTHIMNNGRVGPGGGGAIGAAGGAGGSDADPTMPLAGAGGGGGGSALTGAGGAGGAGGAYGAGGGGGGAALNGQGGSGAGGPGKSGICVVISW